MVYPSHRTNVGNSMGHFENIGFVYSESPYSEDMPTQRFGDNIALEWYLTLGCGMSFFFSFFFELFLICFFMFYFFIYVYIFVGNAKRFDLTKKK